MVEVKLVIGHGTSDGTTEGQGGMIEMNNGS